MVGTLGDMVRGVAMRLLIVSLATAACGRGGSSSSKVAGDLRTDGPDATRACLHSSYMTGGAVLRAAFIASGADVAAWQLNRFGPNGPHAVNQFVTQHQRDPQLIVCYIDSKRLAGPTGGNPDIHYGRVIVEMAVDGTETTDMLGSDTTKIERPHP